MGTWDSWPRAMLSRALALVHRKGSGAHHLTTTPDRSYLVPDVPLGLLALVRELGSE